MGFKVVFDFVIVVVIAGGLLEFLEIVVVEIFSIVEILFVVVGVVNFVVGGGGV